MREEDVILQRLDELIKMGEEVRSATTALGGNYVADRTLFMQWITSSRHLIDTIASPAHAAALGGAIRQPPNEVLSIEPILGVLRSARSDVAAGLLRDREMLISAELFEDGLELAEYMLGKGYKDPAAVVVGVVLESALRRMCQARGIALGGRETLEPLNGALGKHDPPAYNAAVFKQITAWGNIRNDAAHGRWDQYDSGQVKLMLDGVRNFVASHLS